MGKKKITFQCILLLFVLSNTQILSQELFTKKLQWVNHDSIEVVTFQSKDKIVEWGKSLGEFAFVQSRDFCIKESNIFILMVDDCSGISCPFIYIFKEKSTIWELQTASQARLKEGLKIRVDNELEKMIFETKAGRIGELPFKILVQ